MEYSLYYNPIIVQRKDNHDCVRFLTISDLREDLGLKSTKYNSLNLLRETRAFKDKYWFFAYERDLLSWSL